MKPARISLPQPILTEILKHIQTALPNEACGLLGGLNGNISLHIPIDNLLQSPTEFRMAPEEQLRGLLELENHKLDLTAIYHSHPTGLANPSPVDLRSHLYPDSACIILAKKEPEWIIQAFWIVDEKSSVVDLLITA